MQKFQGFGIVLMIGMVLAGLGWTQVSAGPGIAAPTGDTLMAFPLESADGRHQITVIDPRSRTIAVYQIDKGTGAITLKSVRQMHWDLLMEEFNSGNPAPSAIRALADPK